MVVLTVIEKGQERQYLMPHSLIRIGRAPDNVIEIRDSKSSRHHCEIQKRGEDYYITDLDSHNGTSVNGTRIHETELNPGDRISIGLATILFDVKPEIDERQDAQTTLLGYYDALRHRDGLQKLLEVSLAVAHEMDLKNLLATTLDSAIEVTGAERGFIIIEEDGVMKVKVARNIHKKEIARAQQEISLSIIKEVRQKGVPVITENAADDKRFRNAASVHGLNLRSIICMPLKSRNEMLGLIYLDNRLERGAFADVDLRLVQAFCNHVSTSLDNARLYERVKRQGEQLAEVNRELESTVAEQARELTIMERGTPDISRPLKYDYGNIVGTSEAMLEVLRLLDRITDSLVPVLIQGDSGTGKELVARAIHFNGPLKDRKFVTENCAAVPDSLLESELFGHVRGAFTGADRDRKGLFEMADGGTLFLDEVADMSPEMQSKLLRAVEKGDIRRVGGKETIRVNVRIIAASNKDLKKRVEQKLFREDLYYRLNVVRVNLPPLRKRREDIPLLIDHFLTKIAEENGEAKRRIDRKCIALMTEYDWPGNVRELENEIRRLVALSRDTITPPLLSDVLRGGGAPRRAALAEADEVEQRGLKVVVQAAVAEIEKELIERVLEKTGGKKIETARRLGISRPTLDAKIQAYGIKLD